MNAPVQQIPAVKEIVDQNGESPQNNTDIAGLSQPGNQRGQYHLHQHLDDDIYFKSTDTCTKSCDPFGHASTNFLWQKF